MKKIIASVLMLVVAGCASTAAPRYVNGNYYMVGDPGCVQGRALSATRIMCADKKGKNTGYRDAMTHEQLQSYQIQQQMQWQALNQSLQQVGQTFENAGQQITRQSQQYTPPQVQPISPQGASGRTIYRRTGHTWTGSDGSSCQVAGQSILCSDGRRCQMIGHNLICN